MCGQLPHKSCIIFHCHQRSGRLRVQLSQRDVFFLGLHLLRDQLSNITDGVLHISSNERMREGMSLSIIRRSDTAGLCG